MTEVQPPTIPLPDPALAGLESVFPTAADPMPDNIRSIQPGGGFVQSLELEWGKLRRRVLKQFFPGHVARMREALCGDPTGCPVEIIDSRDLKFFRNQCSAWFDPAEDPFSWRGEFPLARAGFAELLLFGGSGLVLTALLASGWLVSPWWAIIPGLLTAFVFSFFRDPERKIPDGPGVVVSPADGLVVDIADVENDAFIGEPAVRIGIFLSVFNVHVNRCSIGARLMWLKYVPGQFVNALFARSAELNERMELGFVERSAPYRKFVIKQIAGAIARRIVCEIGTGKVLERGERFGMIKFGSRTEIILPRRGLELAVKTGMKVKGGATPIAKYKVD